MVRRSSSCVVLGRAVMVAVVAGAVLLPVGTVSGEPAEKSATELGRIWRGADPVVTTEQDASDLRRDPPAPAAGSGVALVPVFFEHDSARVKPESYGQLREIARALTADGLGGIRIRIEGHTDRTGSAAYNEVLSRRRARAVKTELIERFQIESWRLESEGFGESRPLPDVSQATAAGRAANRRVQLVRLPDAPASSPGADTRLDTPAAAPVKPHVEVAATYLRDGREQVMQPGVVLNSLDDRYRVSINPDRESHVYVYQIDATGEVFPLFPNPVYNPAANPVAPGRTVTLPPEGWIQLDETAGEEKIIVLAAVEPLADASTLARQVWNSDRHPEARTRGVAASIRRDAPTLPAHVFSYDVSLVHR